MDESSPHRCQAALLAVFIWLAGACSPPSAPTPAPTPGARAGRTGGELSDMESWIDVYDPGRASPGYNLILYRRRTPVLMDMSGRIVHSWPGVRAAGRARLLEDGSILVIADDGAVRQYDWGGEETWAFSLDGEDFPHHDLIVLANGNRLILGHDMDERVDYLLEVTPASEVVWSWHALDQLRGELHRAGGAANRTHINSVHELASNRWFDAGDERFRPGNILISARNLNALYIIARDTGEVVWSYDVQLDHQHEAVMIPPGRPGAGNVLLFNNGLKNLYEYRRSSIVEVQPQDLEVAWTYRSPTFFSSTGGIQQSLENGNVLVTSSRGGRVFEITRDGEIVWQWVPVYNPMRVHRYPYDHCPQLAARPRPQEIRMMNRNPRRFIDADLYAFALAHESQKAEIGGISHAILREKKSCRTLRLPEAPGVVVGYGTRPRKLSVEARRIEIDLSLSADRLADEEAAQTLFERTVSFTVGGGDAGVFETFQLPLESLDLQAVELCLEARARDGRPAPPTFVWGVPTIRSAGRKLSADAPDVSADPADDELQRKHLKALGYVD